MGLSPDPLVGRWVRRPSPPSAATSSRTDSTKGALTVSRKLNRRDVVKVRAYRAATTATMIMMLAQALGAGKKWG